MPQPTPTALGALFSAFRDSDFLNLSVKEAARLLDVPLCSVREMAGESDVLEIARITGQYGTFDVVRARLTPEAVARSAPVSVEKLQRVYGRSPEGRRQLEAVLSAGGEDGPFHVAGGEVRPGPGVSEPVRLVQAGCMVEGPEEYERGPLEEEEDLRVLNHLEDLEEARINFGVYDTFVSFGELLAQIRREEPGLRATDPAELQAALERLRSYRYVMVPAPERYRSRISETIRVLRRVKQRFRPDDADTAPHLVHSVRVHFQNRRRLARSHPLGDTLERVFQDNRGGGRKVDRARRALQQGFAAALGYDPARVRLTRIQRDALESIAGRYFRQEGQGVVVTGNTGSGKTEAALLPLLLGAMEEKLRRADGADGCKILLVYPRQELAKNQLQRLCRYLAYVNRELEDLGGEQGALSAGILFQDTPQDDDELAQGGRYRKAWPEENGRFVLPYFVNEQDDPVHVEALNGGVGMLRSTPQGFDDGGWELEGFRATREAILRSPPDVLVITTEMLHRWLMNPAANRLFGVAAPGRRAAGVTPPRAVVFDEIHLYDTLHGAQIGMLLRRLRNRLFRAMASDEADDWRYPLMIGMSATIGAPQAFWSELSGLPRGLVEEISPRDEDLEAAQGREYFLFIRPEVYSRGRIVGDASVAIQSIMAIAHNMMRRGPDGDLPPKHRTLVFQDSISKVKKLALEFRDAETNKFLARHRLERPAGPDPLTSAAYADGEYWIFDAEDPFQYGERRPGRGDPPCSLSSPATPVFSGNKGTELLKKDVLFATSVLEVGYDDPSLQFVFQHHAPRNTASFVQKKGRAGRSLQDRPITAVTLSRYSFRDAFFYQNPGLLYDPADYRPPLNVENYFVQRFQALALLFDELVRLTGRDHTALAGHPGAAEVTDRLDSVGALLGQHESTLEQAYRHVAAESFRRVNPRLRDVWNWFVRDFDDPQVVWSVCRTRNLLRGHPQIPDNLFGTVNLPTLRVMYPPGDGGGEWERPVEEDVALAFTEVPPGKVTRRYGRGFRLLWRAPQAWVAIERFKTGRPGGRPDGPFDPALLRRLEELWGPGWAEYLPRQMRRVYRDAALPDRFYRARYLELWDFGTLNPRNPRQPQPSWSWWGRLLPDGSVRLRRAVEGERPRSPWRYVSPDSNSYPLSSAYVRPLREEDGGESPDSGVIALPPLFPGLLDELRLYCGEVEGRRSAVQVWEFHYGAEASVRLVPNGADDPHAGTGAALVRYHSEHDGQPTLYGYDLVTEGLRVPYDADGLAATAGAVFDELWNDPFRQSHLQDQYLRYLLKSESWPTSGGEGQLNSFDIRTAAELISTLRAEARARGVDTGGFLDGLTDPVRLPALLDEVGARYWRDHRVLNEDFLARLTSSLTEAAARPFLEGIFDRIRSAGAVREYMQVTLLHSLKHATRHLFIAEGSTRDEEVGSFGMFRLTHRDWSPGRDFFVYERNQDGSGATRLVASVLREKGLAHLVERWWDVTLACPVGDEEDFLRAALRSHGGRLRGFAERFLSTTPAERDLPQPFLRGLFPDVFPEDEPFLARLAGILTSELTMGGDGIPLVSLHVEIQTIEDELAGRFRRPPTQTELAGFAATEVENDPGGVRFPALGRLRELYRRHAHDLGQQDDEGPANDLDRFLDQVGHLGLSTCVDACPACLASSCNLGHIEVMRHTLSRRYLKTAHRLLSAPFTVDYQPGTGVDELVGMAQANGRWAILTYSGRLPADLTLALHHRFDEVGRIFDHERMELRRILRLREAE